MENNNQIIRVYRNVPSSLSIRFADYRNMATERWFAIDSYQEFLPVSLNYVISMFMLPGTMKAYNQGMFKFNDKDKELVKAAAKEAGFYFDAGEWGTDAMEQPEVLYSEIEIKSFLQRGRTKEINEIIADGNQFQKQSLATFAKEEIDNLRGSMIALIEKGLGIAITETSE